MSGKDWCVKALHPSDPLTEVRGIPDQSAVPSVCLNYQSVFTLNMSAGQQAPWAFDLTMLPHPYFLAAWDSPKGMSPESGTATHGNFWNTQLVPAGTGGQPPDYVLYDAWTKLALRWRLAYMSVTVYQDGPDLANQGTIVVSQAPITPLVVGGCTTSVQANRYVSTRIAMFNPAEEGPNFSRSQAMPNAMMGKSKEGAYAPLKLTDTVQDWHTTMHDYGVQMLDVQGQPDTAFTLMNPSSAPSWPFWSVMPMVNNGATGVFTGNRVVDLLQDNVCHISARNLADTTSYAFHFRMGVEVQLAPSSTLTPQLKLSPPYDPAALEAYFRISRELKDGYPADYNDFGKMWDAISNAVRILRPALNVVLPGLGSAAGGVAELGDTIRNRRRNNRMARSVQVGQQQLTQANKERVQEMRTVEGALGVRPRPRRARSEVAVLRTSTPQQAQSVRVVRVPPRRANRVISLVQRS